MDNNNFNELLLHTLKQLGIRLDRVDDRLDRVDTKLDQKADKEDASAVKTDLKADINGVKTDLKADISEAKEEVKADIGEVKGDVKRLEEKLDVTNEVVKTHGERLDRIEGGIKTLQWVLGVEIALVGIIVAFLKAC